MPPEAQAEEVRALCDTLGAADGDTAALLKSVRCPFLLAPAGNDLPMWSDSGDFGDALKASAKGGECAWSAYPDMSHGWSCRGDLSDEKVKRDVSTEYAV